MNDQNKDLPPLPKPFGTIDVYREDGGYEKSVDGFTADQMRGYAIDRELARHCAAPVAEAQPEPEPASSHVPAFLDAVPDQTMRDELVALCVDPAEPYGMRPCTRGHGHAMYVAADVHMFIAKYLTAPPAPQEVEQVRDAATELERIKRLAACGTVDSFMALPDQDKRCWFAIAFDESERRKLAEARLAFLHSTNSDAEGWEWGVARVRRRADGRIEHLWGASDHSDIDAAMSPQPADDGKAGE